MGTWVRPRAPLFVTRGLGEAFPVRALAASVSTGPPTLPVAGDTLNERVGQSIAGVAGDDHSRMAIWAEQENGNWIGGLERFFKTDFAFHVAWCESGCGCGVAFSDEENPFLSRIRFLVHVSYNDGSE